MESLYLIVVFIKALVLMTSQFSKYGNNSKSQLVMTGNSNSIIMEKTLQTRL